MEKTTKEGVKKPAHNSLQDQFLKILQEQQTRVSCYLVNGIRLNGIVMATDAYTVLISNDRNGVPQLVFKAAISTIAPDRALDIALVPL